MKTLLVGDLHIQARDLKDGAMHRFMQGLPDVAREYGCDKIVFMGDSAHTHETLNSYVQKFLGNTIAQYGDERGMDIGFIIGNHDQASTSDPMVHALSTIKLPGNVDVFDRVVYSDVFNAVIAPYMHDNEEFVRQTEACRMASGTDDLLCHQTFKGACYENKFLAADGVDPSRLGFKRIFSGHIHMLQDFSNVHYVGTPRWMTASDYNEEKSIAVFDNVTGDMTRIDSARFFRPWRRYFEKQSDAVTLQTIAAYPENEVVIEGDQEFVAARSAYWSEVGVRHRSKVTGGKVAVSVNSGKAIAELLSDYVDAVDLRSGSSKDEVRATLGRYL